MLYEHENLKLWMPETNEFTSKEEVVDNEVEDSVQKNELSTITKKLTN